MRQVLVVAAAIAVAVPTPILAWNLICGVSIGRAVSEDIPEKWDADQKAIFAVSDYFYAIGELQRVALGGDGSVTVPRSLVRTELSSVESAIDALNRSSAGFAEALAMANALGLGDEQGRGQLAALQEQVNAISITLSEAGHLPTTEEINSTTFEVMKFVNYGIEMGNAHLSMSMPGHGPGGPDFRLPTE